MGFGLANKHHLEYDWTNPLFVTFRPVKPVSKSSRLPVGVRSDAGRLSPPLDALWCLTEVYPEPVRSRKRPSSDCFLLFFRK